MKAKEIRLVADKKSYQVGETAHVLVMTGMPETYLLVTTEARTIQSKRVIHATSATPTIDVPILSRPPTKRIRFRFVSARQQFLSIKQKY